MEQSHISFRSLNLVSLTVGLVAAAMAFGGFRSVLKSPDATTLVAQSAPPAGNVLWSADIESSWNPGGDLWIWYAPVPSAFGFLSNTLDTVGNGGGVFNSGTACVGPSFDIAHSGTYSAKLSIDTSYGQESGVRLFRWSEAQAIPELYYSVWYYFPQQYTPVGNPAWWNVFEWKSKSPGRNNPFFSVNVWNRRDGTMYFVLRDSNMGTTYNQTMSNIPVAQWTRLEAFYHCAGDSSGRVTIWHDGVRLFDVPGPTRFGNGDCEWSVTNYSNGLSPNPATFYIDDAAICFGGRCP